MEYFSRLEYRLRKDLISHLLHYLLFLKKEEKISNKIGTMVNIYVGEIEKPPRIQELFKTADPYLTIDIYLFIQSEIKHVNSYLQLHDNYPFEIKKMRKPTPKMIAYASDLCKKVGDNTIIGCLSFKECSDLINAIKNRLRSCENTTQTVVTKEKVIQCDSASLQNDKARLPRADYLAKADELRKNVLHLLNNGLSYRKIAKDLGISHTHVKRIADANSYSNNKEGKN